jgi:hypothetical protein
VDPKHRHGDVWVVHQGEQVTVSAPAVSSARPVEFYYLGHRWTPGETSGGSATFDVDSFARWGVGRYMVTWGDCSVEIEVDASLFRSGAGIAATAVLAFALVGLALTLTWRAKITNPEARWVLKLMAKGKLERDEDGRVHARFSYTVTQTLLGTIWGLILGGASFTLLQQAAVSPPTIEVALEVTLPLTVLGTLAGLRRGRPHAFEIRPAAVPVSPA